MLFGCQSSIVHKSVEIRIDIQAGISFQEYSAMDIRKQYISMSGYPFFMDISFNYPCFYGYPFGYP